MEKKFKIMKTIFALVFTIIIFIGFHTYNYLKIQSLKFSNEWGKGIEIGKSFVNKEPIIGTYKDDILLVTFNKEGKLLYYLLSETGEVLENNLSDIIDIDINKIKDIYLFENKLFYVKNGELKISYFDKGKGFTKPVRILNNIEGFTLSEMQNELYIGTYDDKNIDIYKFENDKFKKIHEFNNKWNIRNIYLKDINNKKHIFIVDKVNLNTNNVLLGKFDKLDNSIRKIADIKSNFNTVIRDVKVEVVDNEIFLVYPITNTKGGNRTYLQLEVIDAETLKSEVSRKITDSHIDGVTALGESISLYKENGKIKLICSGINMRNKYAMYPDIFEIEIDKQGNLSNVVFISNTESQSKRPSFIRTKFGDYLTWLDIEVSGYKLFINSKNKDFISANNKYTKSDYITAFYRALASPFYALAFGFLKGMESFLYVLVVFLPVGFILRKYRIDKENIKFIIFLSLYIVLNLLLFKSTFYSGYTVFFLPSYLKFKLAPYMMPLILNLISGIIMYIFYKENKNLNYISFLIFFIAVNIYLSNLLYVPFAMTRIILK